MNNDEQIVASGKVRTGSPAKIPKWNDLYYESLKCELMQINAEIMLVTLE
jgi:hypothetical protein